MQGRLLPPSEEQRQPQQVEEVDEEDGLMRVLPGSDFAAGDGFAVLLSKAMVRRRPQEQQVVGEGSRNDEEDEEATRRAMMNVVDYAQFKHRLVFFARRRAQLRNLLDKSHDGRIPEDVLQGILLKEDDTDAEEAAQHSSRRRTLPSWSTSRNRVLEVRGTAKGGGEIEIAAVANATTATGDYVRFCDNDLGYNTSGSSGVGGEESDSCSSVSAAGAACGAIGMAVKRRSKRIVMRRVSNAERLDMILFLEWQMDTAVLFYLEQCQRLSNLLDQIRDNGYIVDTSSTASSLNTEHQQLDLLGQEILELFLFCTVNIVTVRQILIRYDAFARAFEGTPLSQYYMKKVMRNVNNNSNDDDNNNNKHLAFSKLLRHAELHALADAYYHQYQNQNSNSMVLPSSLQLAHFTAQRNMFADVLRSSALAASVASTGQDERFMHHHHATTTPANENGLTLSSVSSVLYTLRIKWYLLLSGAYWSEDRLDLEPSYLALRGQSLTKEMEQLVEWRTKRNENLATITTTTGGDVQLLKSPSSSLNKHRVVKELTGMQKYHLTLNLLSGFLYCMNYYIVEPSSTMYVNYLGAHDAASGMLIGMMPLAAFCSSLPFSMWTNRSFRHPFIMSCILLIVGNLTYSLADRMGQRLSIALLGRFVCGLGAPKCIIRRYMADTTPVSLRTSVNALFGMVVAAGSAMGPAMAVLLNRIEYTYAMPHVGLIFFNGLTLPGYFMASLWFTFTVIVLATFDEPDRGGLKEQKELELMGGIPGSPSMQSSADPHAHYFHTDPYHQQHDDLRTIFSGEAPSDLDSAHKKWDTIINQHQSRFQRWRYSVRQFFDLITLPVRICLALLFAKVFTIEALVSATSALTKNRYKWKVQQVGTLGFINGILVIPFSILVGRLSLSYQDHVLMRFLVCAGLTGLFLLIDISDLMATPTSSYNKDSAFAVTPTRYIVGYFLSYLSIQAFEGVIGSTLSKVIPTALASGTVNSGLLATLVDTFGRACGDLFISAMGFLCLRQLMNLLFIPTFCILIACLVVIERCRDLLSV